MITATLPQHTVFKYSQPDSENIPGSDLYHDTVIENDWLTDTGLVEDALIRSP